MEEEEFSMAIYIPLAIFVIILIAMCVGVYFIRRMK